MIAWAGVFTGVNTSSRCSVIRWLAVLFSCLMAGCAQDGLQNQSMMRGFNIMQHEQMTWDHPQAQRSLRYMLRTGANTAVLIAFLEQESPASVRVKRSDAVSHGQLQKAIQYAHEVGLEVILKPQLLVPGSWAGAIEHDQQQRWDQWFEAYSYEIVEYARFASQHGVHGFVIGTELSKAAGHVNWSALIRRVRAEFSGKVTYAAHNIAGVQAFSDWHKLDAVALTFYPSLGASGQKAEMKTHILHAVQQLRVAVQDIDKPLWVLEVGMPSAKGASAKPWEWHHLKSAKVDLNVQRDALDVWLKALDQSWVDGVFIWAWYSDFTAGGMRDADYTPQNKPAEYIIRRYWKS